MSTTLLATPELPIDKVKVAEGFNAGTTSGEAPCGDSPTASPATGWWSPCW